MKKSKYALAVIALLMAGCMAPPEPLKQTFTVELGEDVYGNPRLYVEDPNQNLDGVEVLVKTSGVTKKDNRFVTTGSDFLAVGEYDFVLSRNGQEIPFKIKVKDTKGPVPTNSVDRIQASYLHQTFDWASIFEATDLSGVYYEGPADPAPNLGENHIQVRIYDRFGNSTYQDVVVVVG